MPKLEKIGGYEIHPAASRFPLMPDPELTQLAEDIQARGQEFPIVLHEGKVLDGRNRLLACERAGIPPTVANWSGKGGSPVSYVVATNVKRRHLTESQRAMVAAELLPLFEREAKDRQRAHGGTAPGRRQDTSRPGALSDEPPKRAKAAEQAAAAASVATRSVERAKFVAKASPELAEKVREGSATLKQAEKQIRKAEQIQKVAKYELPEGEFSVIVADPPWPYEDQLNGSDETRGGLTYPAMTVEEICALEVPAAEDCILWLWVTNAHLLDGSAHRVLAMWDFLPKTMLTWAKDRMGAGRWLRGKTEHVILATRGKPTVDLTNQTTLLEAPRREHSRKPDEFYDLVVKLCPAPAYLEMFSRESRPGWTTSGAEAGQFDEAKTAAEEPAETDAELRELLLDCQDGHYRRFADECRRTGRAKVKVERRPSGEACESCRLADPSVEVCSLGIDFTRSKSSKPGGSSVGSGHSGFALHLCPICRTPAGIAAAEAARKSGRFPNGGSDARKEIAEIQKRAAARVYDREGAIGTVDAPLDDGKRCGVRDGKSGPPCILEQGHDPGEERPIHSTGGRTWRERKPKGGKR